MAIIPQISLFNWQDDIDELGDLERFYLVLENIDDEKLMRFLEDARGRGRNEYPVRVMWNVLLAMRVFEHPTVASVLRELNRNVQLRYLCGIDHIDKVPKAHNISRFLTVLQEYQDEIDKIFQRLVHWLRENLAGFGQHLAMDSKNISSFAKRANKNTTPDGRRETDADFGVKTYSGVDQDGKAWQKTIYCFGFKLHLIVDSAYELPVTYSLTKASRSDVKEGHELIDWLAQDHPHIIEKCQFFTADRGYDDGKLIEKLKTLGISPIIDNRILWQDELERPLPGYSNVYYNEKSQVFCYDSKTQTKRTMANNGYESARDCLRKKCPAKAYGVKCPSLADCPVKGGIRIPLSLNQRIFLPVDRSSYKFKDLYAKRTAVERVNSRLDVSYGFENHTIRGQKKMRLHCSLALIVMLGMAVGRIKKNQSEHMRSLIRSA